MPKYVFVWDDDVSDSIEVFAQDDTVVIFGYVDDMFKLSAVDEAKWPGIYALNDGEKTIYLHTTKNFFEGIQSLPAGDWKNFLFLTKRDGQIDNTQIEYLEYKMFKMFKECKFEIMDEISTRRVETFQRFQLNSVFSDFNNLLERFGHTDWMWSNDPDTSFYPLVDIPLPDPFVSIESDQPEILDTVEENTKQKGSTKRYSAILGDGFVFESNRLSDLQKLVATHFTENPETLVRMKDMIDKSPRHLTTFESIQRRGIKSVTYAEIPHGFYLLTQRNTESHMQGFEALAKGVGVSIEIHDSQKEQNPTQEPIVSDPTEVVFSDNKENTEITPIIDRISDPELVLVKDAVELPDEKFLFDGKRFAAVFDNTTVRTDSASELLKNVCVEVARDDDRFDAMRYELVGQSPLFLVNESYINGFARDPEEYQLIRDHVYVHFDMPERNCLKMIEVLSDALYLPIEIHDSEKE